MDISYIDYESMLKSKLPDITEEELISIVPFMYADNWTIKDTINHIKSVRNFNKRRK